jgi:hypothetical protein
MTRRCHLFLDRLEDRIALSFGASLNIGVGDAPTRLEAADLNGDGIPDLVGINANDGTEFALLSNGDGTFTAGAGGSDPGTIGFLADFAVDHFDNVAVGGGQALDLVVIAISEGNFATQLLGDRAGGFTEVDSTGLGFNPIAIVSGDFDGDGDADVAVSNEGNEVEIYLGNNDGSLTFFDTLTTGAFPDHLILGDFNEDNIDDLLVANGDDGTVDFFPGNGNGGFTSVAAVTVSVGIDPQYLAKGDFNEDGHLDFVVVNNGSNQVRIVFGNGSGGFTPSPVHINVGANPSSVVVAKFNRDDHLDLAVANRDDSTVTVLFGDGMGNFNPDPFGPYSVGGFSGATPSDIVAADFNNDGLIDIAVANADSDEVNILFNLEPLAGPTIAVGAGGGGGPHVITYAANGNVLSSFFAYDRGFTGGVRVAVGDVNNDGFNDVVTGAGVTGGPHVRVWSGRDGSEIRGWFAFDRRFLGGVFVATGDINGDRFADVVVGAGSTGGPHVTVWDGRTGGLIHSFFAYDRTFPGGVRVAAADVDGDGLADIVTGAGPSGGPHVRVFRGRDLQEIRGFFAFGIDYPFGVQVAAGDLNGDGRADIITTADLGGGPHVRAWDGATGNELYGFFPFDVTYTGGVRPAIGDVDGNRRQELVLGNGSGVSSRILIRDGSNGSAIREFSSFAPGFLSSVYVAANSEIIRDPAPPPPTA